MNPVKKTVVLVDYGLATVMMPTTLAGSQIGAQMILKTFPPLVIQILLVCLLSFLMVMALQKAVAITKQESVEMAKKNTKFSCETEQQD
jgi:uncharacterized membrane protein YfcA